MEERLDLFNTPVYGNTVYMDGAIECEHGSHSLQNSSICTPGQAGHLKLIATFAGLCSTEYMRTYSFPLRDREAFANVREVHEDTGVLGCSVFELGEQGSIEEIDEEVELNMEDLLTLDEACTRVSMSYDPPREHVEEVRKGWQISMGIQRMAKRARAASNQGSPWEKRQRGRHAESADTGGGQENRGGAADLLSPDLVRSIQNLVHWKGKRVESAFSVRIPLQRVQDMGEISSTILDTQVDRRCGLHVVNNLRPKCTPRFTMRDVNEISALQAVNVDSSAVNIARGGPSHYDNGDLCINTVLGMIQRKLGVPHPCQVDMRKGIPASFADVEENAVVVYDRDHYYCVRRFELPAGRNTWVLLDSII